MANGIARYTVMNGLAGCYMPDNVGTYEFRSRRELAEFIRERIEWLDWPANTFAQANLRRVWKHIARHGSSVAHFAIQHKSYELAFHGLTDAEYEAAQAEDEDA
jgi:hypothetical protein